MTITVAPNRKPVAVSDTYSTPANTALDVPAPGILANDYDPDGDTILASNYFPPSHGTLDYIVTNGWFRYVPAPGFTGDDTFTYIDSDGTDFSDFATITIHVGSPVTPTTVTQVFVNGPGLTGGTSASAVAFRIRAGIDNAYGYPVPAGTNQLKTVPWVNGINTIAIRFGGDASGTVDLNDLRVWGSGASLYTPAAFHFDAATKTAVWTMSVTFTQQKLLFILDDAGILGLDGEWANGSAAEAYPSGNGVAGGDFAFRVNVLSGDANQDGSVNAADLGLIKQRLNRTAINPGSGTAAYSPFADENADGAINALDLGAIKPRLNRRLPVEDPAPTGLLATALLSE